MDDSCLDDFDPDALGLPPVDEAALPDSPAERDSWGGVWLGSAFDPPTTGERPADLGQSIYAGLAEVQPGLVELARLGSTDFASLDAAARVSALIAFERARAWLDAQQETLLALISTTDRSRDRWCVEEVGAALRLPSGLARSRLESAEQLCHRLPQVLDALAQGTISAGHAAAVADISFELPDSALPEFEERVLDRAGEHSVRQIRQVAKRAALALDPASAEQKHQHALAGRQVRIAPADHGMALLSALLPAAEAHAVFLQLDGAARMAAADDTRTLDQLRADALVEGVLAGIGDDLPSAHGRRPTIQVTVGLNALTGLDDEPGWLDGYGPISAEYARRIAHDPTSTWRRLITDPVSDQLLDYGTTRYRPPQHLAEHVIARDGTCSFPFCSYPARQADLDHVVPYPTGGTSADNLQPLHRRHHNAKTSGGWTSHREPDGTTNWTSPQGRGYRSRPPRRWPSPADPADGDSPPA